MENLEKTITAKKNINTYIIEIWSYRELFWILAKRDFLVKYKQTFLGITWAMVRPLVTMLAMAFAFGRIGKLDVNTTIPFTLVVAPGVIIWLFFSQSLQSISQSLVGNANLITKVYFPRLIIPLSTLFIGLVDVIVSIVLFFIICIWFQFCPDFKLLLIPFILFISFLVAFGAGLITAVLNVKYRDFGQIIPFLIQFGTFFSPVAYLTESVKKSNNPWFYKIYVLNPVTGCIDAMRWAMLGDFSKFNWDSFIPLIFFVIITFITSINFFRKHENSFVDYI